MPVCSPGEHRTMPKAASSELVGRMTTSMSRLFSSMVDLPRFSGSSGHDGRKTTGPLRFSAVMLLPLVTSFLRTTFAHT